MPTADYSSVLHRRAEAKLQERGGDLDADLSGMDLNQLARENQLLRIKLDLQSEDLQRSNEACEALLRRIAAIYKSLPIGYVTLDPRGIILDHNLAVASFVGSEGVQLIGRPFQDYLAADYSLPFKSVLDDFFRDGSCLGHQTVMLKPSGRVDVLLELTPTWRANECTVTFTEITECIRLLVTQCRDEMKYRFLFENLQVGVAYCKMIYNDDKAQDFLFLDVNRVFQSLTGFEEIIGKAVSEISPRIRNYTDDLLIVYDRVLRTGKAEHVEHFFKSLGEWFSISAYSSTDDCFVTVFEVITERKRGEQEMLSWKAQKEAALESMIDAVFFSDTDGRFIDFNDAFATFHRFKSKEECLKNLADYPDILEVYFPNGDLAPFEQWAVPRALRGETATNVEYMLRLKSTGEIWVGSYGFAPIRNIKGEIIGSVVTGRDITEQKIVEKALRESEFKFRSIFDHAAVAIGIGDFDGRVIDINISWLQLFGYTREEVINRTVLELGLYPDLETRVKLISSLNENGRAVNEALKLRKRSGEIMDIMYSAEIIMLEGRKCIVMMMTDVTLLTEMATKLRSSEEMYRSLFDNMLNAIAYGKAKFEGEELVDFQYLVVNEAFTKQSGMKDVVGRYISELIPGIRENDPALLELFGRVVRTRVPEQGELYFASGNDWLWLSVYSPAPGYVVFVFDVITKRKRAEEEIIRLNANLEKRVDERTAELLVANRELDSFAYSVSHDLRAPLRAMNGFSRILLEDYSPQLEGDARELLEHIIESSVQMGRLVDAMLALSRSSRSSMNIVQLDLSEMASRIRDELEHEEPERQVTWLIEKGLHAAGDTRMLEVVLRNLLENSWKYSSGKSDARISFHTEDRDGVSWFCIEDNGAGFDMKHANQLFKPFQRLHRQDEFPGIGIGLATVFRIIKRHGGEIYAEAELDKGAAFRFTLPLHEVTLPVP